MIKTDLSHHKNGQLAHSIPLKDEKKHGICSWYHSNGKRHSVERYIDGILHGVSTGYFNDGTLKYIEKWHYDKKVGVAAMFNGETREIHSIMYFKEHILFVWNLEAI